VEAVGDFLSIFEEDRRRASSPLGKSVTAKLKTCRRIVQLVDKFRNKHFSPLQRGRISLTLNEAEYLDDLLKSVSKKRGKTIFVASKDGDSAADFHKHCDSQGPTVVIVQSTSGAVFGGYSDRNWNHQSSFVKSTVAFLFRLRPATSKYPLKRGQEKYAIRAEKSHGPTFGRAGNDHDLEIVNKALTSKNSLTKGGYTYKFPGNAPNYQLTDGAQKFQVKDYFVMKAIKM